MLLIRSDIPNFVCQKRERDQLKRERMIFYSFLQDVRRRRNSNVVMFYSYFEIDFEGGGS